ATALQLQVGGEMRGPWMRPRLAGVLAPGLGINPGTLTLLNRVTFNSTSSYKVDANSTSAKADKVLARGVTINGGAQFFFSDHGSGTLPTGTVFTLISNTATTAI